MTRVRQTVEYLVFLVQLYLKKPDRKQTINWTILVLELKPHLEN